MSYKTFICPQKHDCITLITLVTSQHYIAFYFCRLYTCLKKIIKVVLFHEYYLTEQKHATCVCIINLC